MSRMSVFSSPFMLGFDELERMLDHATKSAGDGYPPYNIERIIADGTKGDALRWRWPGFQETSWILLWKKTNLPLSAGKLKMVNEIICTAVLQRASLNAHLFLLMGWR